MSYSRIPYIYSNGKEMFMDGVYVDEDLINILLYDLHKSYRKDELEERIKLGKIAEEKFNKIANENLQNIREKYKERTIKSKDDLEEYKKRMIELSKEKNYENMWNTYEAAKYN